jgi:hypothetical protein
MATNPKVPGNPKHDKFFDSIVSMVENALDSDLFRNISEEALLKAKDVFTKVITKIDVYLNVRKAQSASGKKYGGQNKKKVVKKK